MSPLTAGLIGGAAAAALTYGIWYVTPSGRISRKVNKTAYEAQSYYKEATKKFQESTPNTNEALEYVKNFAYSYVGWIPGGRKYIDTAFKDLDTVRENHGEEVDKLVNDTYREIQGVVKSGSMNMDTLNKCLDVLSNFSKRIGSLAGDSISEILENHPGLKDKIGPNIDQLKSMGEQYGPEAKKQVDETWNQVKEIMAGGLSASSLYKARQLIEDKVQKVQQLGDEAWKKGMEQAKPYLDKNPKVKELVEKNADALKKGNAKEIFDKVRSSIDSGNTQDLEKYFNQTIDKVKSSGMMGSMGGFGGLEQYFKMIPRGDEIFPKLQQLKEVAEKHRYEGESLLKETMDEVQKVLSKQADKAQSLVEKAKRDSK